MVWLYVVAAVVVFLLLKELMRLPTVGKYGERYVFITGCDTGFGNLLAKRLDSLGFNVFAACFSERGADELRKVSSARLKTLSLDVTKPDSIVKARATVEKQLPSNKGLWAVVNNAGITGALGLSEWMTRQDYERCNSINLYGVIDVTRIFLPLVRKGQGRIVNVSSVIGRIAAAFAPYVVSKYGVEGFTDCLRREVLKQGVTVHLLEPGYFRTNMLNTDAMKTSFENSFKQTDPDVQRYYGKEFVRKVLPVFDKVACDVASPKTHLVVDAYTHAITAIFPRTRYLVGNDCKYYFRLLWNLPEWISDRILSANYEVPEGALSRR
ncbi:retinol dehydrogenase 7-like [Haliotis rubra]|uniref:retinol dehydrogenase 7-like n=1 Tax=Haliotis rubra TaxID=36100 RepID=UPI001EE5F3D9|nr:retinol dehydrogenase 7-like [Haliotis rubra]XP_046569858.1 retinol dehydrogenase 7-like [Haliotis rubra]